MVGNSQISSINETKGILSGSDHSSPEELAGTAADIPNGLTSDIHYPFDNLDEGLFDYHSERDIAALIDEASPQLIAWLPQQAAQASPLIHDQDDAPLHFQDELHEYAAAIYPPQSRLVVIRFNTGKEPTLEQLAEIEPAAGHKEESEAEAKYKELRELDLSHLIGGPEGEVTLALKIPPHAVNKVIMDVPEDVDINVDKSLNIIHLSGDKASVQEAIASLMMEPSVTQTFTFIAEVDGQKASLHKIVMNYQNDRHVMQIAKSSGTSTELKPIETVGHGELHHTIGNLSFTPIKSTLTGLSDIESVASHRPSTIDLPSFITQAIVPSRFFGSRQNDNSGQSNSPQPTTPPVTSVPDDPIEAPGPMTPPSPPSSGHSSPPPPPPPSNTAPTLSTNTGMTVAENATSITITSAMLEATDAQEAAAAITYTITLLPGNGSLYINGVPAVPGSSFTQAQIDLGEITYDHNGSETTSDIISFIISDGTNTTTTRTFTITINPINDLPVAGDDALITGFNVPLTITATALLTNDTDAEGPLSITAFDAVTSGGGTIVDNGDGTYTYTPATGYAGADSFTYTVSDGVVTDTATITLLVGAGLIAIHANTAETYTEDTALNLVNDMVVVSSEATVTVTLTVADPAAGAFNTATSGGVTATYDAVTGVWEATGATADVNALLTGLTFTPAANYNSATSVNVVISDGVNPDINGTKTINAVAVNDAPITGADALITGFGTPLTLDATAAPGGLLANDSDVEGSVLTITGFTATTTGGGIVVDNGDGTFTYTPTASFSGTDSFTYTVSDGTNNSTATVSIVVGNGMTATHVTASETFTEDTALNLANNIVVTASNPTITVTFTLADPTAGAFNTATSGAVTSTYNAAMGIWEATGATADVNTLLANLTFTPATDRATGTTVNVSISDGVNTPITGTKTFNAIAVNDAPVAGNDTISANFGAPLIIDTTTATGGLRANDTDAEGNTIALTGFDGTTTNGGTVIDNGDGTLTYTPAFGFYGSDTFTYTVSDGALTHTATVTLNVGGGLGATHVTTVETFTEDTAHNLTNDVVVVSSESTVTVTFALTDPAAGNFNTATSGAVTSTFNAVTGVWEASGARADVNTLLQGLTFTPAANRVTAVTVDITINDGVHTALLGTKTLNAIAINDAPIAADDSVSTSFVTPLIIDHGTVSGLRANDSDIEGTALTLTAFDSTTAQGGTVVDNGDGTFTYTPVFGFSGTDSFTYTVTDGTLTDTATVNITVNGGLVATLVNSGESFTEDTALNLANNIVITTSEATVTATLTLADPTAGAFNTATSGAVTSTYNAATGVWQATGASASVNSLLAGLTFTPAAHRDTNVTVNVNVSDGVHTDVTGSKLFTATPVNDAPTNITLSSTAINENSLALTAVGTLSSTDVDSSSFSYTLINALGGTATAHAIFELSGNTVQLKSGATLDYETTNSYNLFIRTSDGSGGTFDKAVTVTVTDVLEVLTVSVTDLLYNTTGDDTYSGNAVNWHIGDTIAGSNGNDTLTITAGLVNVDLSSGFYDKVQEVERFNLNSNEAHVLTLTDSYFNRGGGPAGDIVTVTTTSSVGVSISGSALTAPHAVSLSGGSGDDTLRGGAGNDTLRGGNGADALAMAAGIDAVYGDAGNDSMSLTNFTNTDTVQGGSGTDTLTVSTGVHIIDFSNGQFDLIQEVETIALNSNGAHTITFTNDYFSRGGGIGTLLTLSTNSTIGTVMNASTLNSTNRVSLDGGSANDLITGGAAGDTIEANNGNDTIYGNAGNDSLYGLNNDDVIYGGTGSDVILGGSQNDTIYGEDGNDNLQGENNNDSIVGGLGNDALNGGLNDDTLIGGEGSDTLAGSTNNDIFVYNVILDSEYANPDRITDFNTGFDTIDLSALGFTGIVSGAASGTILGYTDDGTDTTIVDAANTFRLILTGVIEPEGAILLAPGISASLSAVNDNIVLGATGDLVSGQAAHLAATDTITAGAGTDVLRFTTATTAGANALTTAKFNNVTGIDRIEFRASSNVVTINNAMVDQTDNGDLLVLSNSIYTITSLDTSGVTGSNMVRIAGSGAVQLANANNRVYIGNGNNGSVTGGTSSDTIIGGSFADTITGGAGLDSLFGGAGNDRIQLTTAELNGSETIDGGVGTDTLYFTSGGINFTNASFTGITSIEGVRFASGANSMVINATIATMGSSTLSVDATAMTAANNFTGDYSAMQGSQRVSVTAGAGNDTLLGSANADTFSGGAGNDSIMGNAGNDRFDFAANQFTSNETINGGLGTDTFQLTSSDTITAADFGNTTGLETFSMSSNVSGNFTIGASYVIDTGTTLTFNGSGSGRLVVDTSAVTAYRAVMNGVNNNDVLTAGLGNDSLSGGDGADQLKGGLGSDTINAGSTDANSDRILYSTINDGAAAGANTGYDSIGQIEIGNDQFIFDTTFNGGAANLDDVTANDTFEFITNAATDFNTAYEALLVTGLANTDLNQAGFTNVLAAINGYGVTAALNENGLIAVRGTSTTAIFYYQESEAGGNTAVTASELTLLGISSGLLTANEFNFG